MMHADYFAPYRFVTEQGERVRYDPSGANVLLSDYDVLTKAESTACERTLLALGSHIQRRLARVESDYEMAAKRKGGKPWTEEQYREAGIELLHLRLKREDHEPLDALSALWGVSRGAAVKRAIAEAHARLVAPYAVRRGEEQAPDESFEQTRPPVALDMRSGRRKSEKKEDKAT